MIQPAFYYASSEVQYTNALKECQYGISYFLYISYIYTYCLSVYIWFFVLYFRIFIDICIFIRYHSAKKGNPPSFSLPCPSANKMHKRRDPVIQDLFFCAITLLLLPCQRETLCHLRSLSERTDSPLPVHIQSDCPYRKVPRLPYRSCFHQAARHPYSSCRKILP